MTETEVKKYLREKARACPKCGGKVTTVALSAGWFDECQDCGHRWNFTNPRGSRITQEEYEERERTMYTPEMLGMVPKAPSSDSGEEGIRIVAKKAKKAKKETVVKVIGGPSKKAAKKAAKKNGAARGAIRAFVYKLLAKKPKLSGEQYAAAMKKEFPGHTHTQTPGLIRYWRRAALDAKIIKASALGDLPYRGK